MNKRIRRILEMGSRALGFTRANPDESAGYAAMLSRLEECIAEGDALSDQQLTGTRAVRQASARKREVRRLVEKAHMPHLVSIARIAGRELPDLAPKFVLPGSKAANFAFRTAARTMVAEARSRKEQLVGHGLVETVLDDLEQAIARFDAASAQLIEGRRAHVGASAELKQLANEVAELVKSLDGVNRLRFAGDAERLAAWESASTVVTTSRAVAPPEVPAAPAIPEAPAA
ncbi:MAG TPA: hypothetical protein VF037_01300 [Gemmatimonadales bacterium]